MKNFLMNLFIYIGILYLYTGTTYEGEFNNG